MDDLMMFAARTAMFVGWLVMIAGGLGLAAFLAAWPANYAWKRWGDIVALSKVLREAKRQGRPVFGKNRDAGGDS